MRKKLLITGMSGLLGSNLAYCLRDQYEILGLYHSHPIVMDKVSVCKCDLRVESEIEKIVSDFCPDIVVHCAAQANVDLCEEDPELANSINIEATKNVVEAIKCFETKLIYISTDLVYDGAKGNYSEEDSINPLNKYAETKLGGEREVLKRPDVLVLRTNFFGWDVFDKLSLGEWVIHELSNGRKIDGFKDAKFSSLYTFDLAGLLDKAIKNDLCGIYNLGAGTSLSKYDFAVSIAEQLRLDAGLINSASIDEFDFKAKRSKDLSLNVAKLEKDIDMASPSVKESIEHFTEDFKRRVPEEFKSFKVEKNIYPQLDIIPYGRQSIDDDDIAAVVDVLKSSNLTQGSKIKEFEEKMCEVTGAKFAVAVNSGTAALHIACMASGMKPGLEGITSPNTFVASANCMAYCGAVPVFADIDLKTYNIMPSEIEKKINERTRVVIPVHFAGQSCDMEAIKGIIRAKEKEYGHKIYIIEDAAHALGSEYKGTKVGSCAYSDMSIMSFHPVKHITTGEGGIVLTNDKALYDKLCSFRSHGITNDSNRFINCDVGANKENAHWSYEQQFLGYNYRITDIQCALGVSQLKKLPMFIGKRREIVDYYNKLFTDKEFLQVPYESSDGITNWHLYVLSIDFAKFKIGRAELIRALKAKGIGTQVHYIPIHLQPYYQKNFGTKKGDCPNAEKYYEQCLSIPLHPVMSKNDVEKIANTIKELIG